MPARFGQGTWEFVEQCWDENLTQRSSARAALTPFERIASLTVVEADLAIRVHKPAGGAARTRE